MPTTWTAQTIHFLTQPELRALFRVMTRKRDRALFLVAYRHGLRASEVGLLHLDDLNFAQQRLTIHRLKRSLSGIYPKPRHDFRDTYGELSGSCRGYLLVVLNREIGRGGRRARCIITSCFQGYNLLITTSDKLGSSILAWASHHKIRFWNWDKRTAAILPFPSRQIRHVDPASPLRQRAANVTPWTVTQRGTIVPLARLGVCAVAVTWRDRPLRIPAVSMG